MGSSIGSLHLTNKSATGRVARNLLGNATVYASVPPPTTRPARHTCVAWFRWYTRVCTSRTTGSTVEAGTSATDISWHGDVKYWIRTDVAVRLSNFPTPIGLTRERANDTCTPRRKKHLYGGR